MRCAKPAYGDAAKAKRARTNAKARTYRSVCALVDARDVGICQVCLGPAASWTGPAEHHHIVFRSRGGAHHVENVITVCGSCHKDIHDGRVVVTGTASYLTVTSGRGLAEISARESIKKVCVDASFVDEIGCIRARI